MEKENIINKQISKVPAPPRHVCVMKDNSAALLISCPS